MKQLLLLITLSLSCAHATATIRWESIIWTDDVWSYFVGLSEPNADWNNTALDTAGWKQGRGGIGYGDGDDYTETPVSPSLYLRKQFTIADSVTIEQLLLDVDYDDGFVAYLNGVEVARSSNVADTIPTYDSKASPHREALMYVGGIPEQYKISTASLKKGENLLAIHIINQNSTSSDMSAIVFLHGLVKSDSAQYRTTPYWFVEPITISDSKLPIIKINTSGTEIDEDDKITAHMGIINNGKGETNDMTDLFTDYDGYIGIEKRGQSSRDFPKRSYSLETRDEWGDNLNVNLLGMPKENDWILYAPYTDKSMLRNVVTYEMAKALDMYSTRTAYCELYINDHYQGIYVLLERIKRDDSRVDIDSMEYINGDDNSLTGGYIFSVDKTDDFIENYSGWTSSPSPSFPNAKDIIFQYVYPKAKNISAYEQNYLQNYVTEAEAALISPDFTDKDNGYNKYFDVGSFVDFMLINEVSKEVDKYRYSTYFYKKKDSKGGEIHAGPIWDYNLGYGNVDYWDYGLSTEGWLYTDVKDASYSIMYWWMRFMQDPHFESIATERYASLRANEWTNDKVNAMIDSIANYVDDAQQRNYVQWPILGRYIWPNYLWENMDYNDEVESFRTWIMARLAWMDNNFKGQQLTPTATLSKSDDQSESGYLKVEVALTYQYFNHKELKKKWFDIKETTQDLYVEEVSYHNASLASLLIENKGTITDEDFVIRVDDDAITGFEKLTTNTLAYTSDINHQHNDGIKVYVYKQKLTVEADSPSLLGHVLEVFNTQGQLVNTYTLCQTKRNDISTELTNGIYIISFEYNGRAVTKKILVND